jgi:hypothetical protein
MPPLWQYFLRLGQGDERISAPQRASIPATCGFWLNHAVRGDQRGRRGHHHRPASQPVHEGHAPVVAVLLESCEGRQGHRCPQRARIMDPLAVLPCKSAVSWGSEMGAMMPLMDPRACATPSPISLARAVLGAEGRAPVVAVLLAAANRHTLPAKPVRTIGIRAFGCRACRGR